MSGHQCTENPPNLDPNSGSGHVEKLGNLDIYVSGSTHSKLALLLVSHVFGYETPNLRKLADKVSEAGFYAVVPDFFHGDPYNPENQDRPLSIWIKDHAQEKAFEESKPIVEALKNKGITSIGAAGFCWGAKTAVALAKQKLVDATVLLHPSRVTVDDIKGVTIPIAVLGAEIDQVSPPELVRQFEDVLASKPEVKSLVKIFPKVKHGWTVRYNAKIHQKWKLQRKLTRTCLLGSWTMSSENYEPISTLRKPKIMSTINIHVKMFQFQLQVS